MPKHAYRNLFNTFLSAFLPFGSISALTLYKMTFTAAKLWSCLVGGPTQKDHVFTQPLSH